MPRSYRRGPDKSRGGRWTDRRLSGAVIPSAMPGREDVMRCVRSFGPRRSRRADCSWTCVREPARRRGRFAGVRLRQRQYSPPARRGPTCASPTVPTCLARPAIGPQGAAITCVNECHTAAASLVPAECMAAMGGGAHLRELRDGDLRPADMYQPGPEPRSASTSPNPSTDATRRASPGGPAAAPASSGSSSWSGGGGASTSGSFSRAVVTSACTCPGALEPGGAPGAACTSATDCARDLLRLRDGTWALSGPHLPERTLPGRTRDLHRRQRDGGQPDQLLPGVNG